MIARLARLALFVLAAFALLLTDVPQAAACSWGAWVPPPLRELIRGADTIVLGATIELDDAARNAIFRVERYLKGSGAEHILLALRPPAEIRADAELRSVGSCGFGTPYPPPVEQPSILMLTANQDGSYSASSNIFGFHTLSEPNQKFSIPFYSFQDTAVMREFSFEELQRYIQLVVGKVPTAPQEGLPVPLVAPLMVTTESGEHYLLPVNEGAPVPIPNDELHHYIQPAGCSTPPCYAYSPNGLDQVLLLSSPPPDGLPTPITLIRLQADAVLFSPTSDAMAVWKENLLKVYALQYPRLGFGPAQTNYIMQPQLVNQLPFNQYIYHGEVAPGRAAWTPDGRMLAFTDGEGLWLWDAFTVGSIPRLLSPISNLTLPRDLPYARYFSPLGRYLAVEAGGERYTLDIINRQQLPDGIISSDDRILLAFDTSAETFLPTIYLLASARERGVVQTFNLVAMRKIEWLDNASFIFVGDYEGWMTYADNKEYFTSWRGISSTITAWPSGGATGSIYGENFAYNRWTTDLAISNELMVFIYRQTNGNLPISSVPRTEHDLAPYLDSQIVDIQWLPPLFYYEE